MLFVASPGGTGAVSHSSRCGKVSGTSLACPLANHSLRRARALSAIGSARGHATPDDFRAFCVRCDQALEVFVGQFLEIDFFRGNFLDLDS